ncbi:hypothetical protein KIW84_024404 [Lathyrus oleraceus]|uniref:Uncharacterized protein n=1 Tax=Pisum sativum TaxID=3888 RepID=A0A9D4YFI5_PEA|nr:hypothetical protein KIW84_024404 [Pisum sativum]
MLGSLLVMEHFNVDVEYSLMDTRSHKIYIKNMDKRMSYRYNPETKTVIFIGDNNEGDGGEDVPPPNDLSRIHIIITKPESNATRSEQVENLNFSRKNLCGLSPLDLGNAAYVRNSIGTILSPASVRCVQFPEYLSNLLFLGSADYKLGLFLNLFIRPEEMKYNSALALKEITAVNEQDADLRKFLAYKAVVDQVIDIIDKG